jgi:hypothetical protein
MMEETIWSVRHDDSMLVACINYTLVVCTATGSADE